jgi:hypothetical protein
MTEVTELIKEYEQQATVKELAQRFGILRMQFGPTSTR